MAKNGSASSLPLSCSVPLLSIGLQHIPRRSFHATLRLQILALTILNRLSITTGKGKQRFFIPSRNGVVSGSLRVSPGLWVISAAWFGVGSTGTFFLLLVLPWFRESRKANCCSSLAPIDLFAFSQPFIRVRKYGTWQGLWSLVFKAIWFSRSISTFSSPSL